MPEFVQFLSNLKQQMSAELTRSDALRALIWPNAGLLLGFSSALFAHAPTWVLIALFALLALFMLLYAGAYVFFAATDPDLLRSEKYKLQKMAIEQGIYGDSEIGLIDPKRLTSPHLTEPESIGPSDV